jgi:hypothetical protein
MGEGRSRRRSAERRHGSRAWQIFGDAQTGKLDIANDRTKATIGIIGRCEARDKQAIGKARGGLAGKIFG